MLGVIEVGDGVGLADEPLPETLIGGNIGPQNLQRFPPGQSRMLDQIHLTHAAGTDLTHDPESGEAFPLG